MEKASVIKTVIMTANQYRFSRNNSNMVLFQHQLDVLLGITSRGSDLKFFHPRNLLPTECLTVIIDILSETSEMKPSLVIKCLQLLRNLAAEKEIRESFHESFNLTPVLVEIIKHNPSVNPLCMESLHLLQIIIYGHKMILQESYVQDLLEFIIPHITDPAEDCTEVCLGLLVNLCKDNFAVQSHLKNMEHSKQLKRTLLNHMLGSESSLDFVIYSFSVVTSVWLHDQEYDRIFNPSNLKSVFKSIFNIILKRETWMSRRYGVDLFKEMLKDGQIQGELSKFSRLPVYIDGILKLIPASTPETVVMVFELLLCFCSVEGLRCLICRSVLSTLDFGVRPQFSDMLIGPVHQVKEPLLAIVHWANQSPDTHDEAPMYALDFLTEIYEELIYSNTRLKYSVHADLVLPVLLSALNSEVDIDSEMCMPKKQCRKKVKSLQLLSVLSGEDDIRKKMVAMFSPSVYTELLNFQLTNNRVTRHISNVAVGCEDWSEDGVHIVIFCLELMSKLRKYMPNLDGLFCSLLQDSKLVPFLSAGMTSPDRTVLQTALQLFTIGTTLDAFPTVLIGDSMASCIARKNEVTENINAASLTQGSKMKSTRSPSLSYNSAGDFSRSFNGEHEASVQAIIDKMQTGLEIKDINRSEIIDIYEHKIQGYQTRENHLQDLLDAKTLALSQADRLIAQHRSRRAQNEAGAHKMGKLLKESELKSEEHRERLNEIMLQKEKLSLELEHLSQEYQKLEHISEEHQQLTAAYSDITQRYESSQKSLLSLKQELKTLTEMHEILQKHNVSLKQQHDLASEQSSKLQEERKNLSKHLKEKEGKLQELTKNYTKLESKYEKTEKERTELEIGLDNLRDTVNKTEQAKKQLQQKVSALELVCKQHEADLLSKDEQIKDLRTNLEKHTQIAALIHSLSSGKSESGASVTK
ncbi:protein CIP2A homolog isoform X2 [Saccostrea echinata]|uniref:protein CIP2A homolog isoform X2 n=1 Tax=Saccostrea echinata TaxID=191078 RepID=UPI002A7F32B2|nr:protein CIP2A homolog isoform X2 [Saccostrea echinata]